MQKVHCESAMKSTCSANYNSSWQSAKITHSTIYTTLRMDSDVALLTYGRSFIRLTLSHAPNEKSIRIIRSMRM